MAGLMDILLALVKVLCGGSTTQEEPPTEYQKPHAEWPTRPEQPQVAPEHHRQVSVVPYMDAAIPCMRHKRDSTLDTFVHRNKSPNQYLGLIRTINHIKYVSSGPFFASQSMICLSQGPEPD